MSYTRLVAYSVVPFLMILGLFSGGDGILIGGPGLIIEAFILAKFVDQRSKPSVEPPLPPNVFK